MKKPSRLLRRDFVYGSIKGIIALSHRKAIHLLKQVIGSSDSRNDGIEKAHPPVKKDELILVIVNAITS